MILTFFPLQGECLLSSEYWLLCLWHCGDIVPLYRKRYGLLPIGPQIPLIYTNSTVDSTILYKSKLPVGNEIAAK